MPGTAGTVPAQFGLFRRSSGPGDSLASDRGLGVEVEIELESYDPALTRRVAVPPVPVFAHTHAQVTGYVVVGGGAGTELTVKNFPCIRRLPRGEQRQLRRSFALARAVSPVGPAFCFLVATQVGTHRIQPRLGGLCDTFKDAATGYGANQIALDGQSLASIVPDGVATVVLRYRHHAPISARVAENIYWVPVPQLSPLAQGPPLKHRLAVKRAILRSLPSSIQWLAADGHPLRAFRPPAAYVRLLISRYRFCIESNCGA